MLLRLLPACAVLASPAAALAEPVLGGSSIEITIQLPDGDGAFVDATNNPPDYPLSRQFNLARCYCAETGVEDESTLFAAELRLEPTAGDVNVPVDVWLGQACLDASVEQRDRDCTLVETIAAADELNTPDTFTFRVDELIKAGSEGTCRNEQLITAGVYASPDQMGNDTYAEEKFNEPIEIDTDPPPVPAAFLSAAGGENAIELTWRGLESDAEDVNKWQLLCARYAPDDPDAIDEVVPAYAEPGVTALWETAETVCGALTTEDYIDVIPVATAGDDAGAAGFGPMPDAMVPDAMPPDAEPAPDADTSPPVDLPSPLLQLDPAYVCGEAESTATSIRAEGLVNGESYYFVLVAVDKAGNVKGATTGNALQPQEVADFWEAVHGSGSEVEGGFCLMVDAFGEGGGPGGALTAALRGFRDQTLAGNALGELLIDAYYGVSAWTAGSRLAQVAVLVLASPLIVLALAWHALTLPGLVALGLAAWLLRRRRRALVVAALTCAPAVASAQGFAPYWEDETEIENEGPDAIDWHAGLRLGPYIPGIDEQLGFDERGDGPYRQMFGKATVLPVLDVDRVLLHVGGGQLAVGGSIGYLGRTGAAWRYDDTNGNGQWDQGEPTMDSPGDETTFRLIPLAATAAYRWTGLDDAWGVPLVPYLRGGLSYYVWWITKPNGKLATVPGMDGANKARGASLGFQGSLGLAVRAERIDPTAAASLRDSGLYHAGFYAEYQIAVVDGFGSEKKLSVGDDTWFAGIDFEF